MTRAPAGTAISGPIAAIRPSRMTIVPRSISPLAVLVINRASTIAIVSALADVDKARAARASKRRGIASPRLVRADTQTYAETPGRDGGKHPTTCTIGRREVGKGK